MEWRRWVIGTLIGALVLAAEGCSSGDHAPADSPPAGMPHFGDQMAGIGRRFERLGRAGLARRWEFARYETEEIRESFEDLLRSPVPEGLESLDLPQLVNGVVTNALPEVESAIAHRDTTAFRAAYRLVALECNACHRNARREFVQVPETPGDEVPVLTPLPASTPR